MSIKHVTDGTFANEVLTSETPVLVDFWADWCPPCRAMSPVLEKVATEQEGQLKVVKLDADENPAMSNQYAIRSLPTMIVFQNGKELGRFIGFMPGSELLRRIHDTLHVTK